MVTEKFEDLVAAGVIDPAKVTRSALQNAASIAGLMLTTEALISELQDDDKPRALPGGMDMESPDKMGSLNFYHGASYRFLETSPPSWRFN